MTTIDLVPLLNRTWFCQGTKDFILREFGPHPEVTEENLTKAYDFRGPGYFREFVRYWLDLPDELWSWLDKRERQIQWGAKYMKLSYRQRDDLALAAGLYIGSVDGWKRSLSLGRFVDDRPVFGAVMRHAARGLMFTFPAAFAVGAASYYTGEAVSARVLGIAFTGLWCVPLYELGWRMFPIKNAEKNAIGATEAGELLFGAFIGQATGIPYR